jgi:hypothetical protein
MSCSSALFLSHFCRADCVKGRRRIRDRGALSETQREGGGALIPITHYLSRAVEETLHYHTSLMHTQGEGIGIGIGIGGGG